MENPFETKKFLEEKQKWYQKLKSEGFKDIETFTNKQGEIRTTPFVNSDVKNLYQIRRNCGNEYFEEYCASTYLYYSACRAFISCAGIRLPFLDGIILEKHAEGYSLRRISKYLETFICRYPQGNGKFGPYHNFSHNYVNKRLSSIKEQVRLWNLTHDEGVRYQDYYDREEI